MLTLTDSQSTPSFEKTSVRNAIVHWLILVLISGIYVYSCDHRFTFTNQTKCDSLYSQTGWNIHVIIQIKAQAGHCGFWWPVGILVRFEDYQETGASWTKGATSNWFWPLFCSFSCCSTNSMSFTLHDTTSSTYLSVLFDDSSKSENELP